MLESETKEETEKRRFKTLANLLPDLPIIEEWEKQKWKRRQLIETLQPPTIPRIHELVMQGRTTSYWELSWWERVKLTFRPDRMYIWVDWKQYQGLAVKYQLLGTEIVVVDLYSITPSTPPIDFKI